MRELLSRPICHTIHPTHETRQQETGVSATLKRSRNWAEILTLASGAIVLIPSLIAMALALLAVAMLIL